MLYIVVVICQLLDDMLIDMDILHVKKIVLNNL
jgi:hypothetical protein